MERMEPRILLSADLPGLDSGSADHDADSLNPVLTPTDDAEAPRLVPASLTAPDSRDGDSALQEVPPPLDGLYAGETPHNDTTDFLDTADASGEVRQVLIIDGSLSRIDVLIQDFLGDRRAGIDQVFVLDPGQNGITQIAAILGQFDELDSAHIVTHAANGELSLGNSTLSNATLTAHGDSLAGWGTAFAANGDILLYGCDLAADADGRDLVDAIAEITGADVAASEDLTGNASRGGDWDLEYHAGDIESGTFGTTTVPGWDGVLGSITVTFTGDVLDADADTSSLANLLSDPGSDGQVSLREAIIAANNDTGTDTIYLGAGTFTLGIAATDEEYSLDGDLDIRDDLVLRGVDSASTSIDGAGIARVLELHSAVVDIADIAIWNGNAISEGGSQYGGGISVTTPSSQLFLSNVLLQGNSAVDGGAIWAKGYVQISDSSIYTNTATADGGGLFVWGDATVMGSTFYDNAADKGGAVFVNGTGLASLAESTLSANQAGSDGGGVYNYGGISLSHVTVADNSAISKAGGLYNGAGFWDFAVLNSIVANNNAPANPDVAGSFLSDGDNLIRTPEDAFGFASDLSGVDPMLGLLTDNGGPSETHALLAGSPAIDAISFTLSTTDQRGYGRPVGAAEDIGAFEFGAVPTPNAPSAGNDGYATNEDTTLSIDSSSGLLANDTDPNADPLSSYVTDGPANGILAIAPTGMIGESNITANAASDMDPVYSPDGSRIAFASDRSGALEIHLMDADGSNVTQLTSLGASSSWPSWSPDGSRLAFQTNVDGNNELYLVNLDGTGLTRLTNDVADDAQPAWSPDGTQIAFRTDRDGNNEIYVINVDGTGLSRLTNDASADRAPAWSPDGSRIAFTSNRDGDFDIYTMNSGGSGLFQVTNTAGDDRAPSYSPDGSKIAFSAGAGGDYEISVINTDGTGLVTLTSNIDEDMSARWSPDGTSLVFRSDRDGNLEIYTSPLLFDGSFDYVPGVNYNGVDSFNYVANDGALNSNTAIATITVDPVNDEQALDTNIGVTLNEGSSGNVIDNTRLATSDVDNTADEISYTVTDLPGNGTLKLSGTALALNGTFTQDDIDNSRLTYDHDGSETTSDSFGFSVDDGAGTATSGTFSITVDPVNDEQALDTNTGPTVAEGSSGNVIDSTRLATSDVDNTADEISYTVTDLPDNGTLKLSGTALALNGTFTQDDINNNRLTYDHDGSETTSDSFGFSVDDGEGNATTGSFNITVDPVNDSNPVADSESFSVLQGGTATQAALDAGSSLLHGDTDPDLPYDTLSINTTPVSGPSHGTLLLNADGSFAYTHDGSGNLSDGFTYEVIDANGAADTATVTITVTLPPPPGPNPEPEPEEEIVAVTAPELPGVLTIAEPGEVPEPDPTETTEETEAPDDEKDKLLSENIADSATSAATEATDEDEVKRMGVELNRAPAILFDGNSSSSVKFQITGLPTFGSIQPASFLSGDALSREIRNIMVSEQFGQELDRMRDEITGPSLFYQNAIGTGAAATTTLSIGYVAWLLRGGVLLSTALSSLPAWQFVDPLPVLARTENTDDDGEGDDSLEGIIRNGQGAIGPDKVDGEERDTPRKRT